MSGSCLKSVSSLKPSAATCDCNSLMVEAHSRLVVAVSLKLFKGWSKLIAGVVVAASLKSLMVWSKHRWTMLHLKGWLMRRWSTLVATYPWSKLTVLLVVAGSLKLLKEWSKLTAGSWWRDWSIRIWAGRWQSRWSKAVSFLVEGGLIRWWSKAAVSFMGWSMLDQLDEHRPAHKQNSSLRPPAYQPAFDQDTYGLRPPRRPSTNP